MPGLGGPTIAATASGSRAAGTELAGQRAGWSGRCGAPRDPRARLTAAAHPQRALAPTARARTAAARLLHGRESERVAALREGALPVARVAITAARAAAQRPNRSGSDGSSSTGDGSLS